MKRQWILFLLLALLLTACGDGEARQQSSSAGRMVTAISVAHTPENGDFDREYKTQTHMNALLSLLRDMPTDEEVTEEPDLQDGQSYYTITVTFANGEHSTYYLLGRTYLRMGNAPWTHVDMDVTTAFVDYLTAHPEDSIPETTAPAATE